MNRLKWARIRKQLTPLLSRQWGSFCPSSSLVRQRSSWCQGYTLMASSGRCPMSPAPIWYPCSCWHQCRRSQGQSQFASPRARKGLGLACVSRPCQCCGTECNAEQRAFCLSLCRPSWVSCSLTIRYALYSFDKEWSREFNDLCSWWRSNLEWWCECVTLGAFWHNFVGTTFKKNMLVY